MKPTKAWAIVQGNGKRQRIHSVSMTLNDARYWARGRQIKPVWVIHRVPGEKTPEVVREKSNDYER